MARLQGHFRSWLQWALGYQALCPAPPQWSVVWWEREVQLRCSEPGKSQGRSARGGMGVLISITPNREERGAVLRATCSSLPPAGGDTRGPPAECNPLTRQTLPALETAPSFPREGQREVPAKHTGFHLERTLVLLATVLWLPPPPLQVDRCGDAELSKALC